MGGRDSSSHGILRQELDDNKGMVERKWLPETTNTKPVQESVGIGCNRERIQLPRSKRVQTTDKENSHEYLYFGILC